MLKRLLRGGITLIGAAVGYGVFLLFQYVAGETELIARDALTEFQWGIIAIACALIFGLLFFLITPIISRKSAAFSRGLEADIKHLSAQDLLAGAIGLITGLIIAFLISAIFSRIENEAVSLALTIAVYIIFAWLGVVIGARKGKDAIAAIAQVRRAGFRTSGGKSQTDSSPKVFDTSVIIDGRVADIMKCGFIEGKIVIPEFVLVELRHIADSSDGLKRERGRRGLDILNKIQTDYGIEIFNTSTEKGLDEIPEVDVKLLKLAQSMGGQVVTNDFNLNKVAMIQGVKVLNINELANALKPAVLPGETMNVFLVKEGKEQGQAVAYLDDGTMIVIEDGRKLIGQTIDVTVTTVLQTSAGRMIFAKPK
ncbi:MAG: PIN/TRAM domain-containing protein [Clostridiales Family XIII bacterium]|jgi:uncharacterized protein YacL|nr:PIN/TRAM domain-containing protein [Clostridiales Family XIII bacterium]